MLFLGSMGVCVSVCVCVCEHPRRRSLLSLSSSPSESEACKTGNSSLSALTHFQTFLHTLSHSERTHSERTLWLKVCGNMTDQRFAI